MFLFYIANTDRECQVETELDPLRRKKILGSTLKVTPCMRITNDTISLKILHLSSIEQLISY
jgi:hypothetical protein